MTDSKLPIDPHARRAFLRTTAATAIVGVTLGCAADDGGEDEAAGSEGGGDCSGDANGTISANHSHTAQVPAADIAAGAGMTYSIMGGSPHDHEITLGADDMAALAAGTPVMVTSTSGGGDGHNHQVTLTC